MIKTLSTIISIMTSINTNLFIYYFKRIPFIGNILSENIYANTELKKALAVISTIFSAAANFVKKALYIIVMVIFPVMLLGSQSSRTESYINIFFFLSLIMGSLKNPIIFGSDRESFTCISLMRIDAKEYFVSKVLLHSLSDFVYFLPALTISLTFLGNSVTVGLIWAVLLACFRLIGEACLLLVYKISGFNPGKNQWFSLILIALTLSAAYIPVLCHKVFPVNEFLSSPLGIIAVLILGLLSVYSILHFNKYQEIAAENLKSTDFTIDTSKLINEAKFNDVKMREKDFSGNELNLTKFDNKTGFDYLNSIFFERHKRILVKPIIVRLAIIAVSFAAAIIAPMFIKNAFKLLSDPTKILPFFIFIMYLISIGERVCKAMFYNCDISLLRYSFYREKRAVLSNFKTRLIWIAGLNLIPAAAISLAVAAYDAIFRLNWSAVSTFSFILSIFVLSFFFSVHHIFLYYIFQPYTTELGVKNPFFKLINFVVYMVCFYSMYIKSPPSFFALIVVTATLIYISAALILVYKLAPSRFRVK